MASCVSLVSLYGSFLRYCLSSAGLTCQSIAIDDDDETTMHFWAPKPPYSSSRPSLLLIHGFGPHGVWQWRQQIAFFSKHFNLFIPDLVFFGSSTSKSSHRSEVFQAICVGRLMEKIGVRKYSVVGTSYGGFVAYHMAAKWPERVEKVVIASSGVNMRKRDNEELLKRAGVEKIEELLLPEKPSQLRTLMSLCIFNPPYTPDFLLSDFILKLYMQERDEKIELLKGLTLGRSDTVNVSPLQQEVLIVWGDKDNIFPLEKAFELKQLLGEKAKLEVIKNTSHVPQIESAGKFNTIVKSFLLDS